MKLYFIKYYFSDDNIYYIVAPDMRAALKRARQLLRKLRKESGDITSITYEGTVDYVPSTKTEFWSTNA